jgi:hypothetical protein
LTIFLLLIVGAGAFAFANKREAGESLIHLGERLSGEYLPQSVKSTTPTTVTPSTTAPNLPESATNMPQSFAADSPTRGVSGANTVNPAASSDSMRQAPEARPEIKSSEPSPSPKSNELEAKPAGKANRAEESDASNSSPKPERAFASANPNRRGSDESAREDDGHMELALAQRYLRGNSVPKDRDMAAHLLWVAVGDGNPEAELELADLYLRTDGVPIKNCQQARILLSAASNSGNLDAGQQLAKLRDYGCR